MIARVAVSAALAASLLAPAALGASSARPPAPRLASLTASPARVNLLGAARQTLRVTNGGRLAVVVDVARAGFALDLRGQPRIVSRRAGTGPVASWLAVRPSRLSLPPGASGVLKVSSVLPRGIAPGDHDALVLVTTRPRLGGDVAIRMQVGIVVVLRAPGRIVRRLALRGLVAERQGASRVLELSAVNRGNVSELFRPSLFRVVLVRRGRTIARLAPVARELLPGSSGLVELRYRGRARGWITALVERASRPGRFGAAVRTFRVRL